jgi:hypothetical protein
MEMCVQGKLMGSSGAPHDPFAQPETGIVTVSTGVRRFVSIYRRLGYAAEAREQTLLPPCPLLVRLP